MTAAQGTHGKMPAPGPLGRNLIANIERLLRARGLSQRRLAAELGAIGRPIPALGLARILKAERRVDVDEMAALAAVLSVSPDDLLSPPKTVRDAPAEVPAALRETGDLAARIEQLLAAPDDETRQALSGYVDRALRRVQIEIEELLAERVP